MRRAKISKLTIIPGVGKSIAQDMIDLGIHTVEVLKPEDPEDLYLRLCRLRGRKIDRCMLYVFRCAIYFARGGDDRELLKWWNWKNREL